MTVYYGIMYSHFLLYIRCTLGLYYYSTIQLHVFLVTMHIYIFEEEENHIFTNNKLYDK